MSQRGVRLHSTKLMQKAPTFTKIHHSALTQLKWSLIRVDSVNMESHLALTQLTGNETRRQLSHHRILKLAVASTKSKTLKSLIIWPMDV